MNRCRYPDCTTIVPEGHSRCSLHQFRWAAGKSPEPTPISPWVRKALAGTLPPRAA